MSELDKPIPTPEQDESSPEQNPSHKIGYGKPPQSGQFAKGQSGNPKGRPKGSTSLTFIVLRESRQLVRVSGPGGSRTVTKLEASMMQLTNKAAQGDLRAGRELFALIRMAEESTNSATAPSATPELDRQVMESLHKRMQAFQSNPDNSITDPVKESPK